MGITQHTNLRSRIETKPLTRPRSSATLSPGERAVDFAITPLYCPFTVTVAARVDACRAGSYMGSTRAGFA